MEKTEAEPGKFDSHSNPSLSSNKKIEIAQKTSIVYEDIKSKESENVSYQRTKRKNKKKRKRKQASVVSAKPEQANESSPGQSNEAIRSQSEQEQRTLPNENNVPAKNNPDTTVSANETKRKNTTAKNSNNHDKKRSSNHDKTSAQKSNKAAQARHRTIVCGDSLVKNVDSWRLKPKCNINEEIVIKCFPGATVKDMRSYIEPSIDRKPDTIILHCGTNDLRRKDKTEVEISKEIIYIAKQIQSNKIDIIVSGLIARGDELEHKREKTNYILRDMCYEESITYTDHPNIEAYIHLNRSKLHLNRYGDSILAANLLKASRL